MGWQWRPRRAFLLPAVLGFLPILWADSLPLWSFSVMAALALLLIPFPAFRHRNARLACLFLALLCLRAGLDQCFVVRPALAAASRLSGETVTLQGRVSRLGELHFFTTDTDAALPAGTKLLFYPQGMEEIPDPGSRAIFSGTVKPIEGEKTFCAFCRSEGSFMRLTVTSATQTEAPAQTLRGLLVSRLRELLPGETGVLLGSLCLGEKGDLPRSTIIAFRRAGLPHLMVVSGLHMSVIAGSAWLILKKAIRHRKWSAIGGIITVLAFAALVGFSASVMRAGLMTVLLMSGVFFRRKSDPIHSLSLAWVVLLLIDPRMWGDFGFLLSFGATAGILCLTRPLVVVLQYRKPVRRRFTRLVKAAWNRLVPAIAVVLAVFFPLLPLNAWLFGTTSVISPAVNLVAVPPAGWLLVCGFIVMGCSAVGWLRPLAHVFALFSGALGKLLLWVVRLCGDIPWAYPRLPLWVSLLVSAGSLLFILWLYNKRKRRENRGRRSA